MFCVFVEVGGDLVWYFVVDCEDEKFYWDMCGGLMVVGGCFVCWVCGCFFFFFVVFVCCCEVVVFVVVEFYLYGFVVLDFFEVVVLV